MNWKLFVPLGLFAAGAVGGYMYASHEYGEEIANVKLQAAIVRANDGRKAYEKLVAAQNALDASRRDAVRLSDDLDRVQRAYKDRDEPLPTPAEWNEPQSPRAKSYSLKAQAWLKEVDAYFKTYPRFTTPE